MLVFWVINKDVCKFIYMWGLVDIVWIKGKKSEWIIC